MKRVAETGKTPARGYLAACKRCGLVVVHSSKRDRPFHAHYGSKVCAELAAVSALIEAEGSPPVTPVSENVKDNDQ